LHHYSKSGATPIIQVGLGEAAVGIVFTQDAVRKGISRGFPIEISYPEEGTPYEIGGVALLRNSPDSKTGKIFIDWISSLKGQNLFHSYGRTPIHSKAKIPESVKRVDEIRLIKMDMIEMGHRRAEFVNRWRRELKQ
ncbi:MAG: ABC transporter substrate-binding protein, partial [bacterium]|nr:ABC transporter substrate-binding protein [bacterium]